MKLHLLLTTFVIATVLVLSMGNKNGRASSANRGNTGAPGDETSLGQPKTCLNCHNQGPILASVEIKVFDSDSQAVSVYHPGLDYTATVIITATGKNLHGYGFQMIALRDSGNIDLDGFSDINPNNYKIASITNGRTYAEHDNISTTNTFHVKWKAPPAGTGSVTFYAAGNGVNANGSTSGDGAGFNSLQLLEFETVAAAEPTRNEVPLKIYPNPIGSESQLTLDGLPSGQYQLSAFNSNAKQVWKSSIWLPDTPSVVDVPAADWQSGMYYFQVQGSEIQTIVKIVKL